MLSDRELQKYGLAVVPEHLCPKCTHPLERIEHTRQIGAQIEDFLCPACRTLFFYNPRWRALQTLREATY